MTRNCHLNLVQVLESSAADPFREAVRGDGGTSTNRNQLSKHSGQTRKVPPIHPRADERRKGTRTKTPPVQSLVDLVKVLFFNLI